MVDPPAIYDVAREGAGLIDGAGISLRFDLAGDQIVGVHISPTVQIKDDKSGLWRALNELLRTK
jgi:hypothetical protein